MLLNRTLIVTMAGAWLLAGATPVLAESEHDGTNSEADAVTSAAAPVTLAQAIGAAEKTTGGRAVEAAYESARDGAVVNVKLVKDKTIVLTRVDATSGEVAVAVPDNDDEDGDAN